MIWHAHDNNRLARLRKPPHGATTRAGSNKTPCVFSPIIHSPHIIFLSQSVLTGNSHLCGTRLCHEVAHAWFGLAIGARDWTEEWLSEGFATHLEDVFWAKAQQVGLQ